jgi:phosphoribosylformimino-5-aminoimidazole carboxamide ribotide isomerase
VIVYAAVDLRGGRVVQLVGGRPEDERIALADPVAVARDWVDRGFRALHVVDLDAALGTGDNRAAVDAILDAVDATVQVGGGVRDGTAVRRLLGAGATRVVVGTRAIEDADWLAGVAGEHPGRIVVAADARDGRLTTRGWTVDADLDALSFLAGLDGLPLGGVLVTDVTREGRMTGIDVTRFAALARATRHPLTAAGGIAGLHDLHALAAAGAAGAVLGMSLYTGAIAAGDVAREFGR